MTKYLLFAAYNLVFFGGLLLSGVRLARGLKIKKFIPASGEIESLKIRGWSGANSRDRKTYEDVEISYAYQHEGKRYVSKALASSGQKSVESHLLFKGLERTDFHGESADDVINVSDSGDAGRTFSFRKKVPVRIDPANPGDGFIVDDISLPLAGATAAFCIFFILFFPGLITRALPNNILAGLGLFKTIDVAPKNR